MMQISWEGGREVSVESDRESGGVQEMVSTDKELFIVLNNCLSKAAHKDIETPVNSNTR